MKKKKLIAMILCGMLAVGTVVPLTACGSSGSGPLELVKEDNGISHPAVTDDSEKARTAALEEFLSVHPEASLNLQAYFGKGEDDMDSQVVFTALRAEKGQLAMNIRFVNAITMTEEIYASNEETAKTLLKDMTGAVAKVEEHTGLSNVKLTIHFVNPDESPLYDLVSTKTSCVIERIA